MRKRSKIILMICSLFIMIILLGIIILLNESITITNKETNNIINLKVDSKKLPSVQIISAENLLNQIKNNHSVSMVHFWASWCSGCSADFEKLKIINEKNRNIKIYMVALDFYSGEQKEILRKYLYKKGISFKSYICDIKLNPLNIIIEGESSSKNAKTSVINFIKKLNSNYKESMGLPYTLLFRNKNIIKEFEENINIDAMNEM